MNMNTESTQVTSKNHQHNRKIDLETFCPNQTTLTGLCQKGWRSSDPPRCLMSINAVGRLGNTMGQYATLFAMARWNSRPAFMLPEMAKMLRPYFRVTMPVLNSGASDCLQANWSSVQLHDWMDDSYRALPVPPQQPLMLTGYPCSWTFYDHVRDEILREFSLHEHVETRAQDRLRALLGNRPSATFVGVHVRRTDYVWLMTEYYKGVMADADFLSRAMTHFRSRYDDVMFVVASDDMAWCRDNIDTSMGDVEFAGSGNASDPAGDLALLFRCNHSVITIGTYSFWSAYLAGGETVYLSNFILPQTYLLQVFHYEDFYLPEWIPIPANLSGLAYESKQIHQKSDRS